MDRDLDAFVKTLTQTADDKGMRFMQRTPLRHHGDLGLSADQIAQRLHHEYMPFFNSRGGKINLLVVITPAKSCQQYAPIKRYCDTVAGIASQCVVKFNVRRKTQDRAFACNLLMKINAKLGGVNVSLRELPPMLKTGTVCPPSFALTVGLPWGGRLPSFSRRSTHPRESRFHDGKY